MTVDLRGRSLLKLEDFTPAEIGYLVALAAELKAAKAAGTERPRTRAVSLTVSLCPKCDPLGPM